MDIKEDEKTIVQTKNSNIQTRENDSPLSNLKECSKNNQDENTLSAITQLLNNPLIIPEKKDVNLLKDLKELYNQSLNSVNPKLKTHREPANELLGNLQLKIILI